ncbi:hypothetical protein PG993_008035 [Apiospora rasikravindrae]|uniref:Uncharacterized protein n=1 Tax=Apiospora rasikravindrae TaxID=990691 RepID=A0ABR1SZ68_9PEZI
MDMNYARKWEDIIFMVLVPPLVAQQFPACAINEYNAFRFRTISPNHTALAVAVFYPGLCYACGRLYSWADRLHDRQARLSRMANREDLIGNRHLSDEAKAALPKSPHEIGTMSPQFAPAFFAALAFNLRTKQLDRSLATCYQVWEPHSGVGRTLFGHFRAAATSTPILGALAIQACSTLWEYKKEADKHHERTL